MVTSKNQNESNEKKQPGSGYFDDKEKRGIYHSLRVGNKHFSDS